MKGKGKNLKCNCVLYILQVKSYLFLKMTFPVNNLQPFVHMQPKMAMNVDQHKIVNLLKTYFLFISFY